MKERVRSTAGTILTEKQAKYWEENPARVLFCPPQIPHLLAWGRTSASAMRSRLVSNRLHHDTRERPSLSKYTWRNTSKCERQQNILVGLQCNNIMSHTKFVFSFLVKNTFANPYKMTYKINRVYPVD
jgi:hypothetical protein